MITHIEKRNGNREEFSPTKINGWGTWAAKTLGPHVDWASVVLEAVGQCPSVCSSLQLQETLIKVCISKKTWEYNRMAGRLYASLLERLIYPDGRPSVRELHSQLLKANIMVELNYSDEEYAIIEHIIDHKTDLKYPHYQINQIRFKYALRNKFTNKEYETPQFVYMRMAMALAENEPKDERIKHIESWYGHFSNNRLNPPTPNFVNLGTRLNGYASCFPAGTLVDTLGGQKAIETVEAGDVVLTAKSRFKQVKYATNRPYDGKLFTFGTTLTYKNDVNSTADHKFLVSRDGGSDLSWIRADEVKVGDYAFHPLPESTTDDVYLWDVVGEELASSGFELVDGLICKVNKYDNAGEFSKKRGTIKNVQLKNNKDFYRLVGYYFAEGCITFDKQYDRTAMGFTFGSSEKNYVDDVRIIMEDLFGVITTTHDDTERDNCLRIGTCSYPLGLLMAKICGIRGAEMTDKTAMFITSDKESLEHLISGYLRGDGWAVTTGLAACSISRELINFIRDASLKCGYIPNVRAAIPTSVGTYSNAKRQYSVRINLQPGDSLSVKTDKHLHLIKTRGTKGKHDYVKFISGGVLAKIRSINDATFTGMVYDIGVEDDTSFTVDGMAVHNCCLYTTDDSAPSLAAGDHIAYMMTCMSAGIGTHIKTRSIGDPVRGGVIQHQGKLPYYRAMVGAIGANLQNGRGGASTVYYTAYDPEVEVIQKLRHPLTPLTKKIAGCHYNFGSNKFFARKVARNETYAPFSYATAPDLYEAQYAKDQTVFENMYKEYEKTAPFTLNAREIALGALTQSYETGVQYLHFTDALNKHTPFKCTIYSSNLCGEIEIPTSPYSSVADLYKPVYEENDGEIGLCSLAGTIVSNIESDDIYADVTYYGLKMIDVCIHKSDYVFPSLAHTAKARMSAGVGILGLAHLMAKEGLRYDTLEGRNFIHELSETHMWHLINASLRLGKELGNAPWMHKTMWPEGWLPIDTYEKKVDELVTVGNKRDWESLRGQIITNQGIRNSVLVAHMPGESSTLAAGTTNGPYPIRETYIMKTNDTLVNHWVAPDSTRLKNKYQSAWDITTTDMIKVYAVMQKWTDQGISADLFVKIQGDAKVSSSDMIRDYLDMVKLGLKARYYVNSLTSSGVDLTTSENAVGKAKDADQLGGDEPDGYCEGCSL